LPGTTTTLTASPNPVHVTASVTYTATVSGTSPGPAPTGTVDFKEGGTTVGSGTLAGGIATFTTNYPSAGSHTLTAVYDGDGAYGGSTSSAVTEIVLDTTSTDLVGTPNPVDAGAPVTYTAVVGSPGGMPTGSVDFK
jgi:hypothetical protein